MHCWNVFDDSRARRWNSAIGIDLFPYLFTLQVYDIFKQTSPTGAYTHDISNFGTHYYSMQYSYKQRVHVPSHVVNDRISHHSFASRYNGRLSLTSSIFGQKGFYFSNQRQGHRERFRMYATVDVAGAIDVINDLGLDTLTFLGVTVIVVPAFKIARASPVRITLLYQYSLACFLHSLCHFDFFFLWRMCYIPINGMLRSKIFMGKYLARHKSAHMDIDLFIHTSIASTGVKILLWNVESNHIQMCVFVDTCAQGHVDGERV